MDPNWFAYLDGKRQLGGGVPFVLRFGPALSGLVVTPNITPDSDTGIGKWSADQFYSLMHTGRSPVFQSESLPPRERAIETLAIQLRRGEGIHRVGFATQTGFGLNELVGPKLQELTALELLHDTGETVALTRKGKCLADAIVEALLGYAQ